MEERAGLVGVLLKSSAGAVDPSGVGVVNSSAPNKSLDAD